MSSDDNNSDPLNRPVCTTPSAPQGVPERVANDDAAAPAVSSPELDAAMHFRNTILATLKTTLASAPASHSADDAVRSALVDSLRRVIAEARGAARTVSVGNAGDIDAVLADVEALTERFVAGAPFERAALDQFNLDVRRVTSAIFRLQGKLMDVIKQIKKQLIAKVNQ
jgi:hypothetical protein